MPDEPVTPDAALAERLQQAVTHHRGGALDEAEAIYRSMLRTAPTHYDALQLLGALLLQRGQHAESLAVLDAALALGTQQAALHRHRGLALKHLGRFGEAAQAFQAAVERDPADASSFVNLGIALLALARPHEAVQACTAAIRIAPGMTSAHINLAAAWLQAGVPAHAEAPLRRALELDPKDPDAWNNLGVVLRDRGKVHEAIACHERTLALDGTRASAQQNLALALMDVGRPRDGVDALRRALALEPEAGTWSNLVYLMHFVPGVSGADLLKEAKRYAAFVARTTTPLQDTHAAHAPSTLRVGWVSGDLRTHPVAYFLEGLLQGLRSIGGFELIAFATSAVEDAVTQRLKPLFDTWHTCAADTPAQLASRVAAQGVDILIDLAGHTAHNRLPAFAARPAPLQVSWLGYFGTTGLAAIDYIIADPFTVTPGMEAHFVERVWRLPETRLCYTPPRDAPDVAALPASTTGVVTFGCFNNAMKVNDVVIALWARVLHAVPGARLLLKARQFADAGVCAAMATRFGEHGIAADRLAFEPQTSRAAYFDAYARIDVALDPFPFTGGTTTAESLWMGVPALTLAGDTLVARQGVGMLANVGLQDWIAADADAYVHQAVTLSSDLASLASLRAGLRERCATSPLFDTPRFARHFAAALRGMWAQRSAKPTSRYRSG